MIDAIIVLGIFNVQKLRKFTGRSTPCFPVACAALYTSGFNCIKIRQMARNLLIINCFYIYCLCSLVTVTMQEAENYFNDISSTIQELLLFL